MSHEYLSHLLMIKSYAFRIGTNFCFVAHAVCVVCVCVRARSFTMNFKTKWNYAKIWIVLVISVRKEINKKRHNNFWFIEIINKPRINIINSDENVCANSRRIAVLAAFLFSYSTDFFLVYIRRAIARSLRSLHTYISHFISVCGYACLYSETQKRRVFSFSAMLFKEWGRKLKWSHIYFTPKKKHRTRKKQA